MGAYRPDHQSHHQRTPGKANRGAGRQRDRASHQTSARRPLVKALARAWRWQRMLDEGVYGSVSDIAEAERINRSYVSRVLRLTLLAPDIIERIVDGRNLPGVSELLTPFPIEWEQQRSVLLCAHPA
jgi:hypothetical protein